jgi:hypothetical protein
MRPCLSRDIDIACSCPSREPVLNGEIPTDGVVGLWIWPGRWKTLGVLRR